MLLPGLLHLQACPQLPALGWVSVGSPAPPLFHCPISHPSPNSPSPPLPSFSAQLPLSSCWKPAPAPPHPAPEAPFSSCSRNKEAAPSVPWQPPAVTGEALSDSSKLLPFPHLSLVYIPSAHQAPSSHSKDGQGTWWPVSMAGQGLSSLLRAAFLSPQRG